MCCFNWYLQEVKKIPSLLMIFFQDGRQVPTSCLCGGPNTCFFAYLSTKLTARSSVYRTIKIKAVLLISFYITITFNRIWFL